MRNIRTLALAALALVLFSAPLAQAAGIFIWGAEKMKDGFKEVNDDLGKIMEMVQADGRSYPSYMDYKTAAFTLERKVECSNQLLVVGDDVLIEEAEGCVIVVAGDAEIDRVIDSIVIVEGRVKNRWNKSFVKNSLLATSSRIAFGGIISKSTVYAKNGAKIDNGDGIISYATKEIEVKNLADPIKFLEGKPLL